jgi:hypothetical protein
VNVRKDKTLIVAVSGGISGGMKKRRRETIK